MVEWYEFEESERVKKVYGKYKIEDFWNWWSRGQNKVMEVRIKDYELIKLTADKLKIPYSPSGVYVWNSILLKNVIAFVRDKATVWFGVNPRKKAFNAWGKKGFGGKDVNVEEIGFMFIDIDRVNKDGVATNEDLKNADMLANKILDRFSKEKWNKGYVKICSGHGVQLIMKLDFPIMLPELGCVEGQGQNQKVYILQETHQFKVLLDIIRKGIGSQIKTFSRKYKAELKVDIDKSGFNIGRVAALPVTKNFKYNTFRWRGIVDLKDGENLGLSDYIMSKEEDLKEYKRRNVFVKKTLSGDNVIKKGQLSKHKLVRFMLDNKLPYGEINNKVWFQLKCILRDSKFDLNSKEFMFIHKQLETKLNGNLSLNLPEEKFQFSENIINSFFIKYGFTPIYTLWPTRTKLTSMMFDKDKWKLVDIVDGIYKLDDNTTIIEDMNKFKETLTEGNLENTTYIAQFLKGCIEKYSREYTKYLNDYILDTFLNKDSK